MKRYEVSASQWRWMEGFLPGRLGSVRATAKDNRQLVNGVLWVLRSVVQWKDLPAEYGNWKSVHRRFTRWARAGLWEQIFRVLLEDSDNTYSMIDSTIVWAHQQAASGKGGARTRLWGVPEAARAPRFACWPAPREGLCALPSLVGSNSLLTIDNAGEYEILATGDGSQKTYPFYVTATPKAQR